MSHLVALQVRSLSPSLSLSLARSLPLSRSLSASLLSLSLPLSRSRSVAQQVTCSPYSSLPRARSTYWPEVGTSWEMFSQLRSSTSNKAREKEKERDRESENGRERERERGESESVPHSLEKSTLPRTLTYILRSIRHSVGPLGFECWAHSRTACPSGEGSAGWPRFPTFDHQAV